MPPCRNRRDPRRVPGEPSRRRGPPTPVFRQRGETAAEPTWRLFLALVVTPLTGPCSAYGHNRRTACRWFVATLLSDSHGLFDQRLDDLRLRHGLDHLTLDEDLPLAITGRDAEVRLARFTGTIDDTAHHRDAQRHLHALQAGGDLVGQRVDVDLGAPARRAGDDLERARPQVERLQDLVADLDLFDRRRRQRDPDRVA